jgi:hypothetical protein
MPVSLIMIASAAMGFQQFWERRKGNIKIAI